MNVADRTRTIAAARATGSASLAIAWSDGTEAVLNLTPMLTGNALAGLRDPAGGLVPRAA